MDWLLRILEGLTISIGVPLCFYLLARFFPFKPQIPPKETVSFDELRSKVTSGGNDGESPYHVVYFSDGSIWSTRNGLYSADQNLKLSFEKEKEIFAFVAMKCGKEIERYDFLDNEER